jgi:hypothetical protein
MLILNRYNRGAILFSNREMFILALKYLNMCIMHMSNSRQVRFNHISTIIARMLQDHIKDNKTQTIKLYLFHVRM